MSKLAGVLVAVAFVAVGCGGSDDNAAEPRAGDQQTAVSGQVPFDRAFIDAMVPHHRDAIAMAEAAKDRGLTQPELDKVATDIIASQQREIDEMLDWREQWFGSRTLGSIEPEVLGVPESELAMDHGGADAITGAADVDATFAEMMIPHHQSAIVMAEAAGERAEHEEVKELAAAIIEAQEREIDILELHATAMNHG